MLTITASSWVRIREQAESGYPEEICGLLVGEMDGESRHGREALPARNRNVKSAHHRYDLDPSDYLRIDRAARERGLEVLGIYHSHPDHPCRPSQSDLDGAWPGFSYLIVSVQAGSIVDQRSWVLKDGAFQEEPLKIERE